MTKPCRDSPSEETATTTGFGLKFQQVYYVLDSDLRILWVGGDWDEFAMANAGSAARSNEVLSTALPDHIADATTTEAVLKIVRAVMEMKAPLRIDYRCDSNSMLRRFQLTVQPMRDNRILMVHDLRDARTFDRPLMHWRFRADSEDVKCSFCCSISFHGGPWVPPEDLAREHPAEVAYTVCPRCKASVEEAVSSVLAQRKPTKPVTGGFGP